MTLGINYINKQISAYTSNCLSNEYALLVSGEWGVGKTYILKRFQKEFNQNPKNKFYYISLNGVSSTQEIDDLIFSEIYPILGNDSFKFGKQILEKTLKATLKIDLNFQNINSGELEVTLPQIKLPKSLMGIKNTVFCFDDIERANLNIKELLGYLNYFIEHEHTKVILVADEKRLIVDEVYNDIKEKIIGTTLHIEKNMEEVFENLVRKFETDDKEMFYSNRFDIYIIMELLKYGNFRALKQSMINFCIFKESINQIYKSNVELIKSLMLIYIYLSLSVKKNYIKVDDLIYLEGNINVNPSLSKEEKEKLNIYKQKFDRTYQEKVLTWDLWFKIIKNSGSYENSLNGYLETMFTVTEEKDWVKLKKYRLYSESYVVSLAEKLKYRILNDEIDNVNEINQIVSMFIVLNNERIVNFHLKTLMSVSLDSISRKIRNVDVENCNRHEVISSLENYFLIDEPYYDSDSPVFVDYYEKFKKVVEFAGRICISKIFIYILKDLCENPKYFYFNFLDLKIFGAYAITFVPPIYFFQKFNECNIRDKVSIMRKIVKLNLGFNSNNCQKEVDWKNEFINFLNIYQPVDRIDEINKNFLLNLIN